MWGIRGRELTYQQNETAALAQGIFHTEFILTDISRRSVYPSTWVANISC